MWIWMDGNWRERRKYIYANKRECETNERRKKNMEELLENESLIYFDERAVFVPPSHISHCIISDSKDSSSDSEKDSDQ